MNHQTLLFLFFKLQDFAVCDIFSHFKFDQPSREELREDLVLCCGRVTISCSHLQPPYSQNISKYHKIICGKRHPKRLEDSIVVDCLLKCAVVAPHIHKVISEQTIQIKLTHIHVDPLDPSSHPGLPPAAQSENSRTHIFQAANQCQF